MFTDLAGFSRQRRRVRDHPLPADHLRAEAAAPSDRRRHDGILIKVEADSFLILFKRADERARLRDRDAARLSASYKRDALPEEQVLLCVGIGFGNILRIGDVDVYGHEVNAASKLGEDRARRDGDPRDRLRPRRHRGGDGNRLRTARRGGPWRRAHLPGEVLIEIELDVEFGFDTVRGSWTARSVFAFPCSPARTRRARGCSPPHKTSSRVADTPRRRPIDRRARGRRYRQFYHYFPDKDAALREICAERVDYLLRESAKLAVAPEDGSPSSTTPGRGSSSWFACT